MQRSKSDSKFIPYKELKELIKLEPIPTEPIPYKQGETIINVSLFLDSHFCVLEANSGKKVVLPYYLRLLQYYRYIISNKR